MNRDSMKESAIRPWLFDRPAALTAEQFDAAWHSLFGDKISGDCSREEWIDAAKRAKAEFPGQPVIIWKAA